ncbi:hypothetical protein, conserved [Eimeria maxima]|uniref:TMEM205-like domain-containing protein n=1 Tax=Eimeria maxima TaxID=5804 RepID=U6M0D6_EIMMA|nr:hypothetical protein, conserved [Eimeria maxima]CDJ57682.1 hypothetical protein, conserved [Eimeria maxima]
MSCCMSKLPLVAAGSGVAALLLCLPSSLSGCQSLLQQSDNHPLLVMGMRALLNCSFGALFGSSVWVLCIGSPLLRKHLNRKQLIAFQSEHLPLFSCFSSVFSSLLLFTTCELALDHRRLQAVACASVLFNLANSCFIFPKQVSLLREREELAEQLGAKPDESSAAVLSTAEAATAAGGHQAVEGEDYIQLHKAFRRLHALGMASSCLSLGCLLPFLFA